MGVTIHFKGKIKSLAGIQPLTETVKSIADELEWKSRIMDYDFSEPQALKGIVLSPHPKSESLFLLFDKHGNLNNPIGIQFQKKGKRHKWNSIKTQFAPIHIHIAVVKMLQFVKSKYIPNLKVADDGGYWDTGDLEGLDERRELINRAMDMLEEGLKKIKVPVQAKRKEDEIADIIEKIAREEVFPKLKRRKRK